MYKARDRLEWARITRRLRSNSKDRNAIEEEEEEEEEAVENKLSYFLLL
jgi:hypothetical protein